MKIYLEKIPQKPIIIQGFPGFGLIGTIVTEYLLEHLQTQVIGSILVDELPPMIAVHKGKILEPISIHYCEKYNILILHIMTNLQNVEWQFADALLNIAQQTQAWEIISIEGILDIQESENSQIFSYASRSASQDKLSKIHATALQEGIVQGVAGALFVKAVHTQQKESLTSLFATTHSQMPDSFAAVQIIQILDNYLGLAIDTKPLEEKASQFEEKYRSFADSTQQLLSEKEKKNISYVG